MSKKKAKDARRKAADVTVLNFQQHLATLAPTLRGESERGCVLVGAAFLEEVLEAMLRARLVEGTADPLFEYPQALSSFSAKITLCFAVGAVNADERHDLDVIRDLRNEFAHTHLPAAPFRDRRFVELCASLRIMRHVPREVIEKHPRTCLCFAIAVFASALWARLPGNSDRDPKLDQLVGAVGVDRSGFLAKTVQDQVREFGGP